MWRFFSCGLIVLTCLFALQVEAQFDGQSAVPAPKLTLSPQYPAPGERVTVTVEDYSGVLANSNITWRLDESIALPEDTNNRRSISFVTGEANVPETITAVLTQSGGAPIAVSSTIIPRYLDIIVEPQTFTPPLYAGRALPVHGSIVRVTGLLHDDRGPVDAAKYNYNWKLNNGSLDGGARRGGFQTLYTVPNGKNHLLTLEVNDTTTGVTVARRTVEVEVSAVNAVLYEVSALYGLGTKAVGDTMTMIGNSLTLRAVPYNLDVRATGNQLFTEWEIDGRVTNTGSNPYEITLDRRGTGAATVGFEVRNLKELIQGDTTDVTIQF